MPRPKSYKKVARAWKGFFLGLLACTAGLLSSAQTLPPRITDFPPSSYEGHPQVFSMDISRNGRLAFGTLKKVLLYDGEQFHSVPVQGGQSLYALKWGPEGRLFVGGTDLMGMIAPNENGKMTFRSLAPLLPEKHRDFRGVSDIYFQSDGGVYFNTREGFFYWKGDSLHAIEARQWFSNPFQIGDKILALDQDHGLYWVEGKKKELIEGTREFASQSVITGSLAPSDRKGNKALMLTKRSGFFLFDTATARLTRWPEEEKQDLDQALVKSGPKCIVEMEPERNPYDASYAVGTVMKGVYFLNEEGHAILQLGRDDGLPSEHVWDMDIDRWGNVWACTEKGIALLHTGSPFTFLPEGEAYRGSVLDIERPSSCGGEKPYPLFLATSQATWGWSFEKEGFQLLPRSEGACLKLMSLREDKKKEQRLLIAGANEGIFQSKPFGPRAPLPPLEAPMDGHVVAMSRFPYPSKGGSKRGLLLGGRPGFSVFDRGKGGKGDWSMGVYVNKVPQTITSLAWDTIGRSHDSIRIWAGMKSKGVLRTLVDTGLEGYRSTHFQAGKALPKGKIRVMRDPDSNGVLFGTSKGLYEFQNGSFTPCCRYAEGLCRGERPVFRLERGPEGSLWVLNGEGVEHFVPEANGYRRDSLPFAALNLGAVRSLHPEKERVWLGGDRGIVAYHPDVPLGLDTPWTCRIRSVKAGQDSVLFQGNYGTLEKHGYAWDTLARTPVDSQLASMKPVLPFNKGRFTFEYAAFFPDRQDAVRYKTRLFGFDTAWSQATQKTEKAYTNLPEGDYCFKVKAVNVYGKESRPASYRFKILPPWYRTWWGYSCFGLAGIGFVSFLVWANGRRLRAQKQHLEKVVDERTQEIKQKNKNLEEANEAIQEEKKRVEEAHDRLQEAHREITHSIDYARKIQNALLRSENEAAEHLPEYFVLFKPQAKVSGDFYWFKEHRGYLYIAAMDCTGHGVPGAFMSMLGISQLNEIMGADEIPSPGQVLTELRERVVRELSGSEPDETAKDGMDAAMVKIPVSNPKSQGPNPKEIEFAGAQNPLYVIRKGIADDLPSLGGLLGNDQDRSVQERLKPFKKSPDGIELKGDPMPVGYDEHADGDFTTIKLHLQKGDMLYIFSDGFADQFGGEKGKKFRYGPFKQLLAELQRKPLSDQKEELERTFEEWKGEQEQIDDVLVIGIRI